MDDSELADLNLKKAQTAGALIEASVLSQKMNGQDWVMTKILVMGSLTLIKFQKV